MQLEVGKSYRNTIGEVVLIEEFDPKQKYPFSGDDGARYLSDGRFASNDWHRYNLVSEIPDTDDAKWQALVEVLRVLAEGNESAQYALHMLEETLKEKP